MALHDFHMKGMASEYDVHVGREVAMVLTGGDTDVTEELTERDLLKLEQKHFVALTKQPKTLARLEHMLSTNKPLRN
jgi:3-hydroxyacyl-CoA dehydrogenase